VFTAPITAYLRGFGFETLEIAGVAAAGIFIVPVLSTYSLAGAELVG